MRECKVGLKFFLDKFWWGKVEESCKKDGGGGGLYTSERCPGS